MKVTILRPLSVGALGSFAPGDSIELPEHIAIELISINKAARCVEKPAVREVAAVSPVVETADPIVVTVRKKAAKK